MEKCSFCGIKRDEVDFLIAGKTGKAICQDCAIIAKQALDNNKHKPGKIIQFPTIKGD